MTVSRRPSIGKPRSLVVATALVAVAIVLAVFGGLVRGGASPAGTVTTDAARLAGPSDVAPDASMRATSSPGVGAIPPRASAVRGTSLAGVASPVDVALVPVVSTASAERSVARTALARLVAGRAATRPVFVSEPDLGPLAASLGVSPATSVRTMDAEGVLAAVAVDPKALGIVRASEVTPAVRALAVDGVALFGAERIRSIGAWPLLVPEASPTSSTDGSASFDPAAAWTLVAGGDVMLDRGVYREAIIRRRGVDLPWDGGVARIAGWRCCGFAGSMLPVGRRDGGDATVRDLLGAADLAIVNLEGPAPDRFAFHPNGLVFSFDPALLRGLAQAGIDAVSLANNHVANAGGAGVVETVRHLDALGLRHAGAGSTLAAARRPALLEAGGRHIALLAYDATRPDLAAGSVRPGAAPLRVALARADIGAARAAGADVVIVMVHWGAEYTDAVSPEKRRAAAALVTAGADAVIGSHSHWAGPIQTIAGRPVLYSLGDLVFELYHDRRTLESVLADLTFVGRRLVQLDLHPTLIVDGVQPNLLDPARDGARILADIRRASARLASSR